MTLSSTLKKVASRAVYADVGSVYRRWGQILRESPEMSALLSGLAEDGRLVRLSSIASIAGGAVPRANAYFLVRELPFEQIPRRFGVTRRDLKRVAVVEDGLQTLHRIERKALRPVVKGPESLIGPTQVMQTDLRLFDVGSRSKDELRNERANGALAYLKRGESVSYRVSEDTLKGGIPAQRSQIKNRKPYWYSITTQSTGLPRIVVPEHFDRRYPATLLSSKSPEVVLDKLFVIIPEDPPIAETLLAALHSTLVVSQIEYRGRTNLGEGVLEMKRADWDNLLVPSPAILDQEARDLIGEAFAPLRERGTRPVADELADPDQVLLDLVLLDALGLEDPEHFRISLERDLRSAVGERRERAASVQSAKASKATVTRVATNVDAYAARIAAALEAFPDPRAYVAPNREERLILISGAVEGELTIGEDLLSQGTVFAAGHPVAEAGDLQSAQFVQAVLRHDPDLSAVPVPAVESDLDEAISAWRGASKEWLERFEGQAEKVAGALVDERAKARVRARALALLHGS